MEFVQAPAIARRRQGHPGWLSAAAVNLLKQSGNRRPRGYNEISKTVRKRAAYAEGDAGQFLSVRRERGVHRRVVRTWLENPEQVAPEWRAYFRQTAAAGRDARLAAYPHPRGIVKLAHGHHPRPIARRVARSPPPSASRCNVLQPSMRIVSRRAACRLDPLKRQSRRRCRSSIRRTMLALTDLDSVFGTGSFAGPAQARCATFSLHSRNLLRTIGLSTCTSPMCTEALDPGTLRTINSTPTLSARKSAMCSGA